MPLTDHQVSLRKNHIGASEVASILGKQPPGWPNAYDVYLAKTSESEDSVGNEVQELGNDLEPYVVDRFEKESNDAVVRNQFRVSAGGILSATHDALVIGKPEGVEAKTSGVLFPSPETDMFGEPGTDELPDRVVLQAQAQCAVSDLETVWVPCLIGRRGYLLFKVVRDERLVKIVTDEAERFWHDHVDKRKPPYGLAPAIESLKRIRRVPSKSVVVPGDLVLRQRSTDEALKVAEKEAESAKALLLAAMGDAEAAESEAGGYTYYEQSRGGFDAKRFQREYLDLYQQFKTESRFRVLRFKNKG